MAKTLIALGILFILAGLFWPWIAKIGLGHLPGDVVIKNKNFTFYFPIVTSIVLSILISVIFWLFRR